MDVLDFIQTQEAFETQKYTINYNGKELSFSNRDIARITAEISFEDQYWNSTDFYIFISGLCDEYEEEIQTTRTKHDGLYNYLSLLLSKHSKLEVLKYAGHTIVEKSSLFEKYASTPPTESLIKKAMYSVKLSEYPKRLNLEKGEDLNFLSQKLQHLENDYRKLKTTKRLCEIKDEKLRSLNSNERKRNG